MVQRYSEVKFLCSQEKPEAQQICEGLWFFSSGLRKSGRRASLLPWESPYMVVDDVEAQVVIKDNPFDKHY